MVPPGLDPGMPGVQQHAARIAATAKAPTLHASVAPLAEFTETEILAEIMDAAGLDLGAEHGRPVLDVAQAFPVNIHGLMEQNGAAFVTHAYTELLGRLPGDENLAYYSATLASAGLSKIEIIGEIRYSPEGESIGRNVPGLRQRFLLQRSYRVPLIGRLLRIGSAILLLPRALREFQRLEQATHADRMRLEAMEKAVAATGPGLAVRLTQLEAQLGDLPRLERRLAELEQRAGQD